jgi:TatD DNase family protein
MIETHCHLTDPRLADQLDAVLQRARASGISRIITIGCDPQDDIDAVTLCQGRPMLRCAIGVHPNYCGEVEIDSLDTVRRLATDPAVVALGEMGLDYHYDRADRNRQRQFFEAQLQMAVDLNKPAVIHCREAVDDALAVLANFPSVACDFHCFTGTAEQGKRITDRGYYLGFTGPITYKKNDDLRQVVANCPIDQLLVETDAPYLSPEPVRGEKICEPAFTMHVARKVAQIKNISLDELDAKTTANAFRLFGPW